MSLQIQLRFMQVVLFRTQQNSYFCKLNTTGLADEHILMRLDDTYSYFAEAVYTSYHIQVGSKLQTNRTNKTLLFKPYIDIY